VGKTAGSSIVPWKYSPAPHEPIESGFGVTLIAPDKGWLATCAKLM